MTQEVGPGASFEDQVFKSEVSFGTWDELVVARERLLTEGWEVVAQDRPDSGVRGFAAYKAGEGSTWLKWAVYGRELRAVVRVCATWEEFVREIEFRVDEDMDKSDDLPARQVGFVTYGRATTSGVAEVFRLPLPLLTEGGEPARAALIAILLRSKHPGREGLESLALSRGSRGR
jgi:hypothetical protein